MLNLCSFRLAGLGREKFVLVNCTNYLIRSASYTDFLFLIKMVYCEHGKNFSKKGK